MHSLEAIHNQRKTGYVLLAWWLIMCAGKLKKECFDKYLMRVIFVPAIEC